MSSTDPAITGALQALDASRKAIAGAHQMLFDNGEAAPDMADLVEVGTLLAAVAEKLMAVNSLMIGRRAVRGPG